MTLIRTYESTVNTIPVDRLRAKHMQIINGCIRCIVYIDRTYKDSLDIIYDEFNVSKKVKLLRKLHEQSTDTVKPYIIRISLMLYYIDDEKKFIETFNKFEEMIDMPAALMVECRLR